ncbi:SH3 domain-containing protein [Streptomyces dangxiongensis]|uniref:SH3 domain-containing protein n=1 Tax=Streptomyces dangxiongensis TaxID=1442032 RepID=A0A3G2JAW4_9ACTN|nr:SH3 domain-containing protein [Streptomyces dangxiongensis]AYN39443.1 SH3 domain-containing protein [Streptomyces dangxiongensis]
MRLRRSLTRCLAVAVATGVLAGGVAVAPAVADDGRGTDDAGSRRTTTAAHDDDSGPYQGVVTARGGLWLRDRPDRGSRRVRLVPEGETVSVFCKTGGEPVRGNPLWYLLTDGTWAWGPAAYIRNVGPAPRWC